MIHIGNIGNMTTNVNIGYKGVSKSVCCLVRFPTDVVWVGEPDWGGTS